MGRTLLSAAFDSDFSLAKIKFKSGTRVSAPHMNVELVFLSGQMLFRVYQLRALPR